MKSVKIGAVTIGNGAPVAIQSMTNVPTSDPEAAVRQVNQLAEAGCDIVRLAVPDEESARAMEQILARTNVPLVADIHFDYRLALMCIERGVHKIRINPGNIGGEDRARAVARAAGARGLPIRIGVNGGSLEKGLLERCGGDLARAMAESARTHVEILNRYDFDDIVLSMKSSSVKTTIDAYRLARELFDYPLHLGVTEAGTTRAGIVKSAIGIGSLLADGIGATIRVSLTDDPIREAEAAKLILRALDLDQNSIQVVSCPTCGRTKYDMIPIAREVERRLAGCTKPITVAVMGCPVNGPGEAAAADVGIAGGNGKGILFRHGVVVRQVPQEELLEALMALIEEL